MAKHGVVLYLKKYHFRLFKYDNVLFRLVCDFAVQWQFQFPIQPEETKYFWKKKKLDW